MRRGEGCRSVYTFHEKENSHAPIRPVRRTCGQARQLDVHDLLKDLEAHKAFNDLAVTHEKVDYVDLYYNAGHPGVPEPHYHIVL